MPDSEKKITYDEAELLEVIKEVDSILISIRKIADFSVEDSNFDLEKGIGKYILQSKVAQRIGKIRSILEEPFEDYPRKGDFSFLEILLNKNKYWSPTDE